MRGLPLNALSAAGRHLVPARRLLARLERDDVDDVVRYHARMALADMDDIVQRLVSGKTS